MKRYAVAQSQDLPRFTTERSLPHAWSRRSSRDFANVSPKENQTIRGLIVALPLAMALWLMLAMLVWMAF